jgi:hypothetical protein
VNRKNAHKIASFYTVDMEQRKELEESIFTELQIAQKRGEILGRSMEQGESFKLNARIRELEQAIIRWYEHDNGACDAELALLEVAEEIKARKETK